MTDRTFAKRITAAGLVLAVLVLLMAGMGSAGSTFITLDGVEDLNPVEPIESGNGMMELLETPNDPYFRNQWGMQAVGMETAWDQGLTGKGVTVGIIDTGVHATHPDLIGSNMVSGYNYLDNNRSTDDSEGHGTFVAGIIGAKKNNHIDIAGMAPEATIVTMKCFDGNKSIVGDAVKAIRACVDDYHCNVINMSFGATEDVDILHQAVQYAAGKGVIIVASAGNEGTRTLYYPAAYNETIGVGAVDANKRVASFSQQNNSVFVVAPGSSVVSLGADNNSVKTGSGTSFAAPFVSGLAVLLKQMYPNMTLADFKNILIASSQDLGVGGYDIAYGNGLINVPEAITQAKIYFGDSREEGCPSAGYRDVPGNAWYHQYVDYALSHQYMTGTAKNVFSPDGTVTRAQVATILYAKKGKPAIGNSTSFGDVKQGQWYYDPVQWCSGYGLVAGYPNGNFGPGDAITREQLVAILYQYTQKEGKSTWNFGNLARYSDASDVSDYALPAMRWAVSIGLVQGTDSRVLSPKKTATRAEIAVVLKAFDEKVGA